MTVIIGLFILVAIVTIHELGHFLVAKHFEIPVEEFAVGIGPKIYSKMWKNTMWSVRVLPLGGFCRLKSAVLSQAANPEELLTAEKGTFHAARFSQKVLVLLGGPLANILSYVILSLLVFFLGGEEHELKAYVEPYSSPSTESELQIGDEIVGINDTEIKSFNELSQVSSSYLGEEVLLSYKRNGITRTSVLTLNSTAPALGVYPYLSPTISNIPSDSVAYTIGLQNNDVIVDINGNAITNAIHIPTILNQYKENQTVIITVLRNNIKRTFEIILKKPLSLDTLGIKTEYVKTKAWNNFGEFASMKVFQATSILYYTFTFLGDIVTLNAKKIMKNTAGPIQLVSIVGTTTLYNAKEYGVLFALMQLLNTTAILSIAIASLNLLPIPVLDGGQIVFYTFYRFIKKTPRIKSLYRYNAFGSIVLLFLFGLIIFSDIVSLF